MTTMIFIVGAPSARTIQRSSINWKAIQNLVYKLQVRIAKAIKSGCYSKAKALQWILTYSFYAKQRMSKYSRAPTGSLRGARAV